MRHHILVLLVLLAGPSRAHGGGELILLQQLTRHGVRSPKSSFATECPNDPWTWNWTVWGSQLTGLGMQEEAAIGEVTRRTYGSFLGSYNGTRHFVRSVDSDRVLQSAATALFFGIFPPGNGPPDGLPGRPVIVPVHTVR